MAAFELQTGEVKVIDVAMKYGYESPEAFSRAFKKLHGVMPAATWAVFDVTDGDVQAMWKRIWAEWFPTSGYEEVKGVSFEMYYGFASHENVFSEICVPIKKK